MERLKIIGNGMVAQSFRHLLRADLPVVIFASGVSDSQCSDDSQFIRERELLVKSLNELPSGFISVYMGTCSVYDPSLESRPYVLHKSRMEQLVLSRAGGLVIRLPQLVGTNAPPSTLVRYLVDKLRSGEPVAIWEKAKRSIIDVEHVVKISEVWLSSEHRRGKIMNIANPNQLGLMELVKIIEGVLNVTGNIRLYPIGSAYPIDTDEMLPIARKAKIVFDNSYVRRTISKYYK
jgi:nucleoside-diphosphate-sugar epimerase